MTETISTSGLTLAVIDMQPEGFPYAQWIIGPVVAEILSAKKRGDAIALIRYNLVIAGAIAPAVLNATYGYDRLLRVDKSRVDGSAELLAACETPPAHPTQVFRLCGVCTDECVIETAHGLATRLPQARIEVVKAACESWQGKRFDWSKFARLPNVIPV
jgi:hypothetical protein